VTELGIVTSPPLDTPVIGNGSVFVFVCCYM